MTTYRTIQGDMWDGIAYNVLGNTKYTDILIRANREHINTFFFPAGVELTIPDVEEPIFDKLPPWKVIPG